MKLIHYPKFNYYAFKALKNLKKIIIKIHHESKYLKFSTPLTSFRYIPTYLLEINAYQMHLKKNGSLEMLYFKSNPGR